MGTDFGIKNENYLSQSVGQALFVFPNNQSSISYNLSVFRNKQHLGYVNQLHMSTVVVSNSCNPYTITKIFICTVLVLVGMGLVQVNALSNFDVYEETISSQTFMVLLMVFNEYLFCFIILINSHDIQKYVKRKFLSFPNFFLSLISKRN